MPGLLILLILIFSTVAIGGRAAQKPPESAPQPKESVTVNVAPPQTDSKTSAQETLLEVAHRAVEESVRYIHFVTLIATILLIFMAFIGVINIIDSRRLRSELTRLEKETNKLEGQLQRLEDSRRLIEGELKKLEDGKKAIEDDLERDRKAIEVAREENKKAIEVAGEENRELIEAVREEFLQRRKEILNDMAGLMEQQKPLWEWSETARRGLAELEEQAKSLRRLTETVQRVTLGRSRLSAETRLKALQQLSQLVDPLGIPPLLEVLTDSANVLKLRLEAAYGLGRYSEDLAFNEYYPEIFAGFHEVLANSKTPPTLAWETIRSARRFDPIPDELTSLFMKWEQSDAQAGSAEG
jgi:cell division protein FtsB